MAFKIDCIIRLGVDVNGPELHFRYALPGGDWTMIDVVLDHTALSDEAGSGEGSNFTGAFIGMAAHDNSGRGIHADFAHFIYKANGERNNG